MIPLLYDSVAFCITLIVLGLLVGSFLNVVIHRLPKMMERDWLAQCAELRGESIAEGETFNLSTPRSRCPHCGHQISALENIPVLSYLLLRGKCRSCHASITLRYPLIELGAALLSGYAAWHFGPGWQAVGAALLLWTLLALAMIDMDTQLLPDSLTLPLLWLGLLFNLEGHFTSLPEAVVGAMAGYLSLWSVYWLFKLATGKEGMGYGDFKLLAALGAWMGWTLLPSIILLSSLVGALVGISLMVLAKHGRNIPIPFGPYLAAAGGIALFWGKDLNRLYLGMAM
ncbi:A24 family peptidase [Azovibrio restrictus]|uniref:prepilin peptidase n=1 Tax=Azovibrio restrictus TaxID=146938 RepID=UPI0026EC39B0|nr:A24 family peptidase [Azovibrio restrictus]MDD3483233.1 A24 family peptidase [Azovibrio restrictus]